MDILGAYHFERIFPVDTKNEERTRASGLHLWYRVKFDENTDLKEAAGRLAKLGEIAKVQANSHIQRAYRTDGYRSMSVRVHCDRRRQHVLLHRKHLL